MGTALLAALGARIQGSSWGAVWVVLVPWLLALDRLRTTRQALLAGWLGAVLFALAVLGWFAGAIASYTGAPVALAWLIIAACGPLLQPQMVAVALVRFWAQARSVGAVRLGLLSAATYVGSEWVSGKLFGDTLAHGLHASAVLRQAADLGGAAGLSFVVVLVNECVVYALARAPRSYREEIGLAKRLVGLAAAGSVLLLVALYGRERLAALAEPEPLLEVAAVQAGISDYPRLRAELGTYEAVRLILDAHFELSDRGLDATPGSVDLIVWPETVYPTTYGAPKSEDGAAFDREIERFVAARGVPLVFGTYVRIGAEDFNAAAFLEPRDGSAVQVASYAKQRLFPFTERAPFWLDHALGRKLLPWLGTWRPGTGPLVVAAPLRSGRRLRVAPLVCYDAVDPELSIAAATEGAELLLVLSNDSWFAHGAGPHQHLVVSAFRSIETRLPQVRATTTGISAAIDARGEVLASLATGARGALVASLPRGARERPWAVVAGPWVGPGAAALAGLLGLGTALQRRRVSA